jgi:hypothetical protein
MMTMIATHVHPDLDAICSVWLLQRFGGMDDSFVTFVNTGSPDPALLDEADAVVDTGKAFDPRTLRFDHHHDPSLPAACMLVWKHLREIVGDVFGKDTIEQIVAICDAGDRADPFADESRRIGLHAIFAGSAPDDDFGRLTHGMALLDALYNTGSWHEAGRIALDAAKRAVVDDVVLLVNGGRSATGAAFEAGAKIVLFYDDTNDHTVPIGLMRDRECAAHMGKIAEHIIATTDNDAIRTELQTWFLHPAGFFSGRGTLKAPDPRPIDFDLSALCRLVADAYRTL